MLILSKYIVAILATVASMLFIALLGSSIWIYFLSGKLEVANVNLGVASALSQQQEIKIVESDKIVKEIQWKTNDRIHTVKEYVYDANKTDCANAIDSMRNTF
jgi:hypothetical protein